jgi:cytochrome c-type biogenesis protein CcmH/NrfG
MAVAILEFNAATFPESANAWDSLGEATLADGQLDRAAEHYRRSLELDPDNDSARQVLERIEQGGEGR